MLFFFFEWLESAYFTFSLVKMPMINNFHLVPKHFRPRRQPSTRPPPPTAHVTALSGFLSTSEPPPWSPCSKKWPSCFSYPRSPCPVYPFPFWLQWTLGQGDLIKDSVKQSCLSSLQRHLSPSLLVIQKGALFYPLLPPSLEKRQVGVITRGHCLG